METNAFFICLSIIVSFFFECHGDTSSYTAAVVGMKAEKFLVRPEFSFYFNVEHITTLVTHLMQNYTMKPDIIVFPEKALQGNNEPFPVQLPPVDDYVVPCNMGILEWNLGLKALSCLAKEKKVFLVVNLVEKHFNVSTNRTMRFNTNVVFDKFGAIVQKYRKNNLLESGFDAPGSPNIAIFNLDKDLRIGLITGDDLLFQEPINTLINSYGIKHFVHPTRWYNELPFSTAIQMQMSWAYSKEVVLLSAGYNDPPRGHSGTGIYQAKYGALESSQPENCEAFSLIAVVPKDPSIQINFKTKGNLLAAKTNPGPKSILTKLDKVFNQPSLLMEMSLDDMEEKIWNRHSPPKQVSGKLSYPRRSRLVLQRENIESYSTKLIEPNINTDKVLNKPKNFSTKLNVNETVCSNKFCCQFLFEMRTFYVENTTKLDTIVSGDNFTNYYYRLAAYDGIKNITNGDTSTKEKVQVCGIMPCLNKTIESCGLRTDNVYQSFHNVAPLVTVEKYGSTYIQVGTTFDLINIVTVVDSFNSDTYPIILQKAPTPNEFGGVPDTSSFQLTYQDLIVNNVTKSRTIRLNTYEKFYHLGCIAIFRRIYSASSSSTLILAKIFFVLPLIQIFYWLH